MSKTYKIPIYWESYKTYELEAENLQDAVNKALEQFFSEPDEHYIDDSCDIDGIVFDDYPDEDFTMHDAYEHLLKT